MVEIGKNLECCLTEHNKKFVHVKQFNFLNEKRKFEIIRAEVSAMERNLVE